MRRLTCTLLVLGLAAVAWADKPGPQTEKSEPGKLSDPVEILKKTDVAAKAIEAARYEITLEPTGVMTQYLGKLSAKVVASGQSTTPAPGPKKYATDVRITLPGQKKSVHLSGGTDGETYFLIDHQRRIAYEDIDPAVMGPAMQVVRAGIVVEFFHPTPFKDEISGKRQELRGVTRIAGEECYEIHVVYQSEQAPEATWFVSTRDFLPRRRIDRFTSSDGRTGTLIKTITTLDPSPTLDKDAFKLALPSGYTKTDDFAPVTIFEPDATDTAEPAAE